MKYTDSRDAVFGELYDIALKDRNVILLMGDTGVQKFVDFKKNLPNQFFNVGIAEQNMMSVASGLALAGKHVFVFGISNFITLRCFEQIKIDICSMNLPVTILGMGTGYGYSSDGFTHHVTEDVSVMRVLPNMTIWSPSDCAMMAQVVHLAYKKSSPSYIRIDKGSFPDIYGNGSQDFTDGLAVLESGKDLTIIATSIMVGQALIVADELAKYGVHAGVVDLYRLKPVNKALLVKSVENSKRIVTLEEHTVMGGLGSIVCETLADCGVSKPVKRFGIDDKSRSEIGSREWLRKLDGLDIPSVSKAILEWIK